MAFFLVLMVQLFSGVLVGFELCGLHFLCLALATRAVVAGECRCGKQAGDGGKTGHGDVLWLVGRSARWPDHLRLQAIAEVNDGYGDY
jgi:hypothetical protein